jgi:RNA polymerase sigma-70 factor (ECF subfamily)
MRALGAAEKNDLDHVASVLGGNRNSFAPLVEQYQAGIYNYAYRYTHNREEAADLTQETFLRAFRFLDRYNSRYSFRNWLYAIATNACRDWARRMQGQNTTTLLPSDLDEEVNMSEDERNSDPAELVVTSENTQALAQAIAQLPEDYRACLILFHIEGLSQAELCQILQLPLTVVKNRLYRARLRLRQMLEVS